ncbi:S24 family peptidase [Xanthobacter tagetidis]|nr:S24 family peptidase [Xanthobacter tagetidis]MBB6308939.1 SOS-response transcriptional repressor LexA [Xanthobacter tagetidis]
MNKPLKNPDLGRRIKALRDALGESQAVFGERFHVEQPTVARWEKGSLPARAILPQLAALAGMPEPEFFYGDGPVKTVPLVSWVAASGFAQMTPTHAVDAERHLTIGDLPSGDYFALSVRGDSMDRVAPDAAIIIANRNEIELQHRKFYVFESRGETTFKRAMLRPRLRLDPYSTNPEHEPIFPPEPESVRVLGRVVRVITDL